MIRITTVTTGIAFSVSTVFRSPNIPEKRQCSQGPTQLIFKMQWESPGDAMGACFGPESLTNYVL